MRTTALKHNLKADAGEAIQTVFCRSVVSVQEIFTKMT